MSLLPVWVGNNVLGPGQTVCCRVSLLVTTEPLWGKAGNAWHWGCSPASGHSASLCTVASSGRASVCGQQRPLVPWACVTAPNCFKVTCPVFVCHLLLVHPSIHYLNCLPLECHGGLGANPSWHWVRGGCHPGLVATQRQTTIHTQIQTYRHFTCMSLDCGRRDLLLVHGVIQCKKAQLINFQKAMIQVPS